MWILTTDPRISGLLEKVRGLDASVEAIVVAPWETADRVASAEGVDRVVLLETGETVPMQATTGTLAELAARERPGLMVAGSSRDDKALLAAAAAGAGADVLTAVSDLHRLDEGIEVDRTLLGATLAETSVWTTPVAVSVEAGAVPPATSAPAEIVGADVEPLDVRLIDRSATGPVDADLPTARRIVAVGRGLRSEEDLALVNGLARALDAEVACSRPLAEGLDWFAKDRYVGVSGQHVAPELYVAVGISGQLQHMVGARDAGTIVAINSDKDAPIFQQCDFGIVGDLYEVLPALTEKVTSHG